MLLICFSGKNTSWKRRQLQHPQGIKMEMKIVLNQNHVCAQMYTNIHTSTGVQFAWSSTYVTDLASNFRIFIGTQLSKKLKWFKSSALSFKSLPSCNLCIPFGMGIINWSPALQVLSVSEKCGGKIAVMMCWLLAAGCKIRVLPVACVATLPAAYNIIRAANALASTAISVVETRTNLN